MGISLKPKNVARYRDLAALLMKYGRSDAVRKAGLDEALPQSASDDAGPGTAEDDRVSEQLAADLERLGPTYVKLGQLLASRADFLPASYTEALARLQDSVEPFAYADVEAIVERELGARVSKAFLEFDTEPIAAASLGQVHRARLRDGRAVAVKVQRPGIRGRIMSDLEALAEVAEFADSHTDTGRRMAFRPMLDEFRQSMLRELDYVREARNLSVLAHNLSSFERIVVPRPVDDYTTSCVLTMDYVHGRKITAISPLRLLEVDGDTLGNELFRVYLKQILVDGMFHADPHAGNVFLTDDDRIALIDLGMIGHVAPGLQDQLIKMLLAISDGNGEDVAEIVLDAGTRLEGFDEKAYTRAVAQIVAQHYDAAIDRLDIGRIIMDVTRTAGDNGVRIPPELTMLGKTLLNLDQVSRILAPDFKPSDAIQRHAAEIMRQRMMRAVSPTNLMAGTLEMGQLVQHLPARVNRLLERLVNNEIEVRVNAIDEAQLISGIQKVANRITIGLILAALIVGAAMLMRVPTDWTILGYPGFAMVFFLIAGIGGIVLVIDILLTDRKR